MNVKEKNEYFAVLMKNRALIFLFIVLGIVKVSGQSQREIDSLYNLITSSNDTTRINALNELSRIFSDIDTQKALETGFKALSLSKKLGADKFIAYSLNRVGSVYDMKSMPDSANSLYLDALKLFEKNNDKSGIATVFQNLGVLYYYQEDFDQALMNYNKALEMRLQTGELKYVAKLYNNIGATFRRVKKFDEAIGYYKKAMALRLKQNDEQGMATVYMNMAVAYQSKGDFKMAFELLEKAVEINTRLNNEHDLGMNQTALADLFTSMHDYKKAREYARGAVEVAKKSEYADFLFNAYEALWITDTLNNDYKSAVRDLELAKKYRSKAFKIEKSNALTRMQIVYETEKKDHEIDVLNIEKEKKKNEELLLVLVLCSVSVLLITVFIFYHRKRKDNELLSKQKQEILGKTEQLQQQASEIAKHRSQMNPHFVFNALNSLQGLILSNNTEKSIVQLNALSKLMRQTLNNSEKEWISIDEEISYLKNYVDFELQRFDLKFKFEVNVDKQIDGANIGIPPMIIQPLLENSMKHAGLNTIEGAKIILEIKKNGDKISVSVEDNGNGRKNSEASNESRALSILEKRISETNLKQGISLFNNLKIVDLTDQNGKGIGTRCEFELPFYELY